jgi:hypothetical protein
LVSEKIPLNTSCTAIARIKNPIILLSTPTPVFPRSLKRGIDSLKDIKADIAINNIPMEVPE